MISVVDRLLVRAVVGRDGEGHVALSPPPGGYIVSAMDLDDAMRLLGGRRPRLLLAGSGAVAVAAVLLLAAATLALLGLLGA
jgi:hypothetical protein